MKPLRLLLLCLLLLPLWSEAQTAAVRDSLGILRRAEFHNAPLATLDASAYESSPAAMLYRYPVSYSTLRLQGDLRSESRPILQPEGDGALVGTFRADSYLRLDERSVVTAGAFYERGCTDNVRWNSTADYRLLRPFVLADSVGGDLSTEEYAFRGAYVRRDGRINYGIGIDYRARHEFRQVDPRPHNIVNDLTGTIGAGFSTDRSLIALTARGRIYKQSQEVGFFDERGANTVEFLMTGLGNYFARYVGGEDQSLFYKGKGYALSLTAVPIHTWRLVGPPAIRAFLQPQHFQRTQLRPAADSVTQPCRARRTPLRAGRFRSGGLLRIEAGIRKRRRQRRDGGLPDIGRVRNVPQPHAATRCRGDGDLESPADGLHARTVGRVLPHVGRLSLPEAGNRPVDGLRRLRPASDPSRTARYAARDGRRPLRGQPDPPHAVVRQPPRSRTSAPCSSTASTA